jgi:glycerophosphoryl diester phosphodiesterase
MPNPLIVAHRGASQLAPENSLIAFEYAIQKGADTIELDVHLSKDNQIIIHHDYYLGRTEFGSGFIGNYTFLELQALDIGVKFGEKFLGTKIPSFRDVLHLIKGKTRLEIELRCPKTSFVEFIVDEIVQLGMVNEVEFTSPHVPLLAHVKTINPNIRTGVFFSAFPSWMEKDLGQQHILDWLILLNAQVAHLPFELLDKRLIDILHHQNFMVHGSNLNNESEIGAAFNLQIDQFSTDVLETATRIRNIINAG